MKVEMKLNIALVVERAMDVQTLNEANDYAKTLKVSDILALKKGYDTLDSGVQVIGANRTNWITNEL